MERENNDLAVIPTDDEPDFRALAAAALDNAGIDPELRLREANNQVRQPPMPPGPALIESDQNEMVYEITFDLPDAGLAPLPNALPADEPNALPANEPSTSSGVSFHIDSPEQRRYPQ